MTNSEPSAAQAASLEAYLDELYSWNERLNLTTVPRDQAGERHLDQALALARTVAALSEVHSVVDIGSGGGIPGVVLAVAHPEWRLTLVESDRRKAGFLIHVCGVLGLGSADVLAERAELLGADPAHRDRHDVVVSRATAGGAAITELGLPLLRIGGTLLALVSDAARESDAAAAAAVRCGGAVQPAETGLLRVVKRGPTPADVPRRVGAAQHHPLG